MKALFLLALLWGPEDPFATFFAALPPQQQHAHPPGVAPMTLAELEALAQRNNPEVRVAARRVALAEAGIGTAGAWDDPMLMYRGWGVPVRQPWNLNQAQHMFMLSQSFPGAGKRPLRVQAAAQGIEVAKAELEVKRRDVSAQVRRAFYDLLRSYDSLRVHHEHVALARQGVEAARVKYTVGQAQQHQVLQAQVALTRLVDHLIHFGQEGDLARARLNTLVGRDPAAPLEVAGAYSPPARLPSLPELQRLALASHPELAASAAIVEQGKTRAALARKSFSPDYTVSAGYMLMPGGAPSRHTYMAELSLNLPWLNRSKHEAGIAEAEAESAALQAEFENRRAIVFHQIQEALVRAQAARRLVALYRDTLRPQAQVTLKAASAAYAADRADFTSLLDSQNAVLDVEVSYFGALANLEMQLADLERAAGAPLPREAGDQARLKP